ncbi:porin family protein [Pontibacter fetidus]|uniref:PorT family protein n=1 Tax=Pontibacter fetidus TaxID=2700082 RepID=A0A6B2HBT5_9BACT|nr:porin family protein [Pontibacter fetidus]NDK57154.1 PorT family protein [Pontibacter fetidus]
MKNYLLPALFFFISLGCFAQEQEPEDLQGPTTLQKNHNLLSGADAPNSGFGIKGGVNFANVYGTRDIINTDTHTNFHAGVYAQFGLTESFSLQVEGLYSRKGFETETENRFDYLEVPLLAVYNITDNFSVHLGPQMSIMVAAKQDGKEVNMDNLNTFDYGVAGGLEARFSFVRVGARYNLGFAGLTDEGDTGLPPYGSDMKNSVAQLYLGVGF